MMLPARYQLWDQDRASAVLAMALVHVTADRSSLEPVAQGDVLLELSRLSFSAP